MDEKGSWKVKPEATTLIWQFLAICLGKLYMFSKKIEEEVREFWKLLSVFVQVVYRRYAVCLALMIARRKSMFFTVILVVNSRTLCFFSTLQVLEEEVKKECASCKNYEAQLCKIQVTSKVKWLPNSKNMQICKKSPQICANAQNMKRYAKYANMQKNISKICSLHFLVGSKGFLLCAE